jgi:hypothetical protein
MMNDPRAPGQAGPDAGLCAACAHVKLIANPRGSTFYLCRLSASDPRFPKYPRLPVIQCAGYQPVPPR